jgi:hypothetical protein
MKAMILASALLVSAFTASAQSQEAKQNFQLVNQTGYTLSEIYVSPGNADDWQDDVLGKDNLLEDGKTANIRFKRASKTCIWDLKVVYEDDDSSAVWHDIDLCKISTMTIKYNRKADKTSATFE